MSARVLWLAKGLGRGGAEQLLLGTAPYIDRDRFEIEVAYLLPWKDALVADFEARGVTVHCLENRRPLDPRWTEKFRKLVRSGGFDLVHTHMPYVAAGARLVAPRSVAFVHTEHNLWDRYRLPTRWANMGTYTRNAAAIAVSQAVADTIRVPAWLPGSPPPIDVVRHGADLASVRRGAEACAFARKKLGLALDDLVVGSVANFTEKKDQRTLLTAFASLTTAHPSMRLVLIGLGPLEGDLRALTAQLGLDERVIFTGMRTDVPELLPGFDVFALSSQYEGLPISLLEAMASDIPCVTTCVGGIPEVITGPHEGLMVEPNDPAAFAAALGTLIADPALRAAVGESGGARARTFDLRTAALRTQEIYDRCLGRA